MVRTAVVALSDGLVHNVVVLGAANLPPNVVEYTTAPDGFQFIVSETAQVGDTYADGVFTLPPSVGP